jgi:hypothetical protein
VTLMGRIPIGQARFDDDDDHVVIDVSSTNLADDERLVAGGRRDQSGAADRATRGGLADRVTDAADNVKDRIDGNPASRSGPDATDRRI